MPRWKSSILPGGHPAAVAGYLTVYAALHLSPAAPAIWIVDAGLAVNGGAEIGLALHEIDLDLSSATDERDLDEAANHLAEKLAGPIA